MILRIPYETFLQHDHNGNAPELRSPEDAEKIEAGDMFRASGLTLCKGCGEDYYTHPQVLGALWLHKLCDGSHVKL